MSKKDVDRLREKLPLPPLLMSLIQAGRWSNPGDEVMLRKIPFIHDPIIFLTTRESMDFNSGPLMGPDESEHAYFSEYRGALVGERELPWADVEKLIFIVVNERPGDDVGIALDYRTGIDTPRVIGMDWHSGKNCIYREISQSFEEFVELLEI